MELLDLVFPKTCVSCGRWGAYLCGNCSRNVKVFDFSLCPVCDRPTIGGKTHKVCTSTFGLDGLITIAQYSAPISNLMKTIKYGRVSDAVKETYSIFEQFWPNTAPRFDTLVPVPLHPKRLQERGFNQAELLALQVGKFLQLPVCSKTLIKIRNTVPQASLQKDERKNNQELQQAFVCLYKKKVEGKIIGLVDDVATTRTTLSAACKVLKKAKARQVWGITLAHAF